MSKTDRFLIDGIWICVFDDDEWNYANIVDSNGKLISMVKHGLNFEEELEIAKLEAIELIKSRNKHRKS